MRHLRGSGRTLPDHAAFLSCEKLRQKWEVSPMARLLEEDILPLTPEEPYVLPSFRLCRHAGTLEELRRKR
jgi:hypothetical protein